MSTAVYMPSYSAIPVAQAQTPGSACSVEYATGRILGSWAPGSTAQGTFNANGRCVDSSGNDLSGQTGIVRDANGNLGPQHKTEITDFGCTLGNAAGANGGRAFATCISSIIYYIGPGLASNVAYIGAYFFSYAVALSLNGLAYALNFLATSWELVRDLANMGFILILVYIAYLVMLRAETSGTVRMLAWVIVMALLINFSFFFTRLVIDAGNILAVQFYNAIPAGTYGTTGGGAQLATFGATNVKDLSASVMNALQLQTLWGEKSFNAAFAAAGNSVTGALIIVSVVYLAVAAMLWVLFFTFLQVGVKFILRIVILWFVIIAAPLAFAAKAMPKDSFKKFYSHWQDALIKFSFYPAIFLFMFLVIVRFMDEMMGASGSSTLIGGLLNPTPSASNQYQQSLGYASAIANVSIRMGFVIAMFYIALKVSDWIVKEGSSLATTAISGASRAALTSTSLAGKVGIGGLIGGTIARQDRLKDGGVAARSFWHVGRFLNNRTYDVRNLPGAKSTLNTLAGDVVTGRRANVGVGSKTTARDLEKKVEAFGDWMRNGSEASRKDREELDTRIKDAKLRENRKRLANLNSYDIEKTEKEIKEMNDKLTAAGVMTPKTAGEWERIGVLGSYDLTAKENRINELRNRTNAFGGSALSSAEVDELTRLDREKADIEAREGKSWNDLKAEYSVKKGTFEAHGWDKALTPTELKALENLYGHRTRIANSEKKSWDEIRNEHDKLSESIKGASPAMIASLNSKDIESIIKQVTDTQLKAIKESARFTRPQKESIEKMWHEQSKNAPRSQTLKELGKLGEIHADLLKLDHTMRDKLSTIDTHIQKPMPGIKMTLDISKAETMKKEAEKNLDEQEKIRDDRTLGNVERSAASQKAKKLKAQADKIDKIIEKLKEIPAGIDGQTKPGAIELKA